MNTKHKQIASDSLDQPTKRFISERELSHVSGLSLAFWQKDRWQHKGHSPGCPYIKIGRTVRYELSEALSWLERGRRSDSLGAA